MKLRLFLQIVVCSSLCFFLSLSLAEVTQGKTFGHHGHKGGYDHGVGNHGYGYHGYGNHQQGLVYHKPVLVNKPVVVHQPHVAYKKIVYKPPPPPPPQPLWIKKPVIHHVKEWRLVDVPKVTYKEVLVQPTPYYKTKSKLSHFFDKFKHHH